MNKSALPVDSPLVGYQHDIMCEARNCPYPALVMAKGCNDSRYVSICKRHLAGKRAGFSQIIGANCTGCGWRMIKFDKHYHVVKI